MGAHFFFLFFFVINLFPPLFAKSQLLLYLMTARTTLPLVFLLFVAVVSQAGSIYRPFNRVVVETEVIRPDSGRGLSKTTYIIQASPLGDDGVVINFSSIASPSKPVCQLSLLAGNHILLKKDMAATAISFGDGMLLQGGFPVPVDILPIYTEKIRDTITVHEKVGGRTFSRTYKVSLTAIDYNSVKENGWLKMNLPDDTKFRTVTVSDNQSKSISLQVWPDNGSWWIYEETQFRRSWRIE